MTICKYFAQGHCRKGNQCKFEHIKQPSTQSPQPSQSTAPSNQDFVNTILTDLTERPFLWHFSSYGLNFHPLRPNLPHFRTQELSAEELRVQAYAEARLGRGIGAYVGAVQRIREEAETGTREALPKLLAIVQELRAGTSAGVGVGMMGNNHIAANGMGQVQPNAFGQVNVSQVLPSTFSQQPNVFNPVQPDPTQPSVYQSSNIHSQSQPSLTHSQSQSQSHLPPAFSFGEIPEQPPL